RRSRRLARRRHVVAPRRLERRLGCDGSAKTPQPLRRLVLAAWSRGSIGFRGDGCGPKERIERLRDAGSCLLEILRIDFEADAISAAKSGRGGGCSRAEKRIENRVPGEAEHADQARG